MALPHRMLADLFKAMPCFARMFPANKVPAPRLAEEPTCQKTPLFGPPFITLTTESTAVLSEAPI
jgi:hypothetical protein